MKSFYNLESALQQQKDYGFIIAHECNKPYVENGEQKVRSREYIGFPKIEDYVQKMEMFPHSHEILYDNYNSSVPIIGRLAFDIDIEDPSLIYDKFEDEFQSLCEMTIDIFYRKSEYKGKYGLEHPIEYVWMSTEGKKYSRHVIVKGFSFYGNWDIQMKIFYICMTHCLSRVKDRIGTIKCSIFDSQLARKNATLRMPFNRKLKGNILTFKESKYGFFDGLIKPYRRDDLEKENLITENDYRLDKMMNIPYLKKRFLGSETIHSERVITDSCINNAIKRFEPYNQGIFKIGQVKGEYINLLRRKPSKCLICEHKVHDHENSLLIICNDNVIRYSCRRCPGTLNII